jgi:hypothetical protein
MARGANSSRARSRTMDWIMSCSSVSLKDIVFSSTQGADKRRVTTQLSETTLNDEMREIRENRFPSP